MTVLQSSPEFLLVTVVLYPLGRLVLEPLVAWVVARRDLDPTMERTLRTVDDVSPPPENVER